MKKINLQDGQGNEVYPVSDASVIKYNDKTVKDTLNNMYSKDEVLQKIKDVIGTAPEALDTLKEIADALGDDPNFAGTMTTELSKKSNTGHTHDDRYYTESEMNTKLNTKFDKSGGVVTGQVTITGSAANKPLNVRGINGISADGSSDDTLYLNVGNDKPVCIGAEGNEVYHKGNKPKLSELSNDVGYITAAQVDTSKNHVHENKETIDKITEDNLTNWNTVTSKLNKTENAVSATKLFTARNINGVSFNGTADITIKDNTKLPLTQITAATDFNTLKTTGVYNVKSTNNTNAPATGHCTVFVSFDVGTPYQLCVYDAGFSLYKRNYNGSAGTWRAWTNLISKSAVGLGNVDNTSDASKPISTATKTALDNKVDKSSVNSSSSTTPYSHIPYIGSDGVIELGKYIDFHSTNSGNADYDVRLEATTADLKCTKPITANLNGNASTATKLQTARNIALTGSVTGNVNFDGSGNVSISTSTNHTHNYAGSSSAGGAASSALTCTGNAATSTKLATARSITLSGDYSGSVNFDGSGNVTLNGYNYYCSVQKGNTNNYPYCRIAHCEGSGSFADNVSTLFISQGYQGGRFGILRISLRSNDQSATSAAWAIVDAKWLIRSGFDLGDIQIAVHSEKSKWFADVFYKANSTYSSLIAKQLDSGGRGSCSRAWTLINCNEPNNATSATNCYKTITDYNSTYTSIATSIDTGYVGTAAKTVSDSDGNQINTTYIKKNMTWNDLLN